MTVCHVHAAIRYHLPPIPPIPPSSSVNLWYSFKCNILFRDWIIHKFPASSLPSIRYDPYDPNDPHDLSPSPFFHFLFFCYWSNFHFYSNKIKINIALNYLIHIIKISSSLDVPSSQWPLLHTYHTQYLRYKSPYKSVCPLLFIDLNDPLKQFGKRRVWLLDDGV